MATDVTTWLQGIGTVGTAFALMVGALQARLLRQQLLDERARFETEQRSGDRRLKRQFDLETERSRQQNAFLLIEYIERPANLEIRRAVDALAGKPFDEWDDQDRLAADNAWRLWTVISFYQQQDLVLPEQFVHRYWGNTVMRHWSILKPYVVAMRCARGAYMASTFEELAKDVERLGWFAGGQDRRPPLKPPLTP